jgi:hypothetical protein
MKRGLKCLALPFIILGYVLAGIVLGFLYCAVTAIFDGVVAGCGGFSWWKGWVSK